LNVPKLASCVIVAAISCALLNTAASAQTTSVVNPKLVEFDPSPDHSGLTVSGDPVVTRYDLQVFLQGASAPVMTTSLGKPAADLDGKIRVDVSTLLVAWPLVNGTYEARVAAIGPTGAGISDASNAFDFLGTVPSCSFALSSTSLNTPASGGGASVALSASDSSCAWSASSAASWITVSPTVGTGNAMVTVAAGANAGAARTGTATVGGPGFTVMQSAAPCSIALSSASMTAAAAGASAVVGVNANLATCGWTASSGASWLTVNTQSGTGSGNVMVTAQPNAGAARVAIVTIGGLAYTVSQAAATVCGFTVGATAVSVSASGSTGAVRLTATGATCGWTARSTVSWVTMTATSGTGSASVGYSVAKNGTLQNRTGTVEVGGKVITIAQAAGTKKGGRK
jgi:hypothetical protein